MSRGLRILHLADSHIGAGLPARPRKERPRRGDDFIASYRRVLRRAIEHDVDLVLHAGDVFNEPNPSGAAVAAAAQPLLEIAACGIPIVIVPGNHERSAIPGSLLFSHPNMHIVDRPRTVRFALRGVRVSIVGIPCIRRGVAERFGAALGETEWSQQRGDLNILLLHQTIESATCGPGSFRFRRGEDVIDRERIPGEFDYVALGHIHRQQVLEPVLGSGGAIVYAGSPDRISFAERDEPKGCMLVEEQGGRLAHRFLEHEVRPMVVVPIDMTDLSRRQIVDTVSDRVRELPPGAHAALRLTGRTTPRRAGGLRLEQHASRLRPDLLLRMTMRQVEFAPERVTHQPSRADGLPERRCAFNGVGPRGRGVVSVELAALSDLPNVCGTYALYDRGDRLLYVGKSKHVRTRVRSHLRNNSASDFFSGWSQQIARVDLRPASSELEALLVEADLVRRLRPPFNRQMRSWARYCYLSENGKPYGQLTVTREPVEQGRCFGPYRSRMMAEMIRDELAACFGLALCPDEPGRSALPLLRDAGGAALCERYFGELCAGPCADRIDKAAYGERIGQFDAVLTGRDETVILQTEQVAESISDELRETAVGRALAQRAVVLREAFEQGVIMREAEALRGGLVLLPGGGDARLAVHLRADGLGLSDPGPAADGGLRRLLDSTRRASGDEQPVGRLAKDIVDMYATVVRHLRRNPEDGLAIPAAGFGRLGMDSADRDSRGRGLDRTFTGPNSIAMRLEIHPRPGQDSGS
jgi:exonuclease SbcD